MKILVTGSKGFIGKNLIVSLKEKGYTNILEYDKDSEKEMLENYCIESDIIYHLAGSNRPKEISDFSDTNIGLTEEIINYLEKHNRNCPIVFASSIQAEKENPYGMSKKEAENVLFEYGTRTNTKIMIYRFPNVFGKWCRPNYNSVIATFCYNIARGLPISINEPAKVMELVYIDDLVNELLLCLTGEQHEKDKYCFVPITYSITLKNIADNIENFRKIRTTKDIPDLSSSIISKLYSTYISYIPQNEFSYELDMHIDTRGSFTEFLKTLDKGQISVNISKPGIIKGNHWHHSKTEKFLVVYGQGIIRLRQIDSKETIQYLVNGEKLTVVDIPPGYTHNIENLGNSDMVTIMWVNEVFDPKHPDTFYLEV